MATVKGDVHDIGKNIVGVVLQCNNFDVVDLGVMVPAQKILATAREQKADAIGLSGLITPSLEEMAHVAARDGARRLHAAAPDRRRDDVARPHGGEDRAALLGTDRVRAGRVARRRRHDEPALRRAARTRYVAEVAADYERIREQHARKKGPQLISLAQARANAFAPDVARYTPPVPTFLGRREIRNADLAEIAQLIDWAPFFQAWELAGPYPAILDDPVVGESARTVLRRRAGDAEARRSTGRWLAANGVVGFWPANARDEDIVLWRDESRTDARARLARPATAEPRARRASRTMRSPTSSRPTGARRLRRRVRGDRRPRHRAQARRVRGAEATTTRRLMLKAIADRLAEAFAEWLHRKVRRELWGYARDEALDNAALIREEYRGIRPAPGYPGVSRPRGQGAAVRAARRAVRSA